MAAIKILGSSKKDHLKLILGAGYFLSAVLNCFSFVNRKIKNKTFLKPFQKFSRLVSYYDTYWFFIENWFNLSQMFICTF